MANRFYLLTDKGCPFCAKALFILSSMPVRVIKIGLHTSKYYNLVKFPALARIKENVEEFGVPAIYDAEKDVIYQLPRDPGQDWDIVKGFMWEILIGDVRPRKVEEASPFFMNTFRR